MFEWLTVRSIFGAPRWALVLLLIALIILGIFQAVATIGKTVTHSQTQQREAGAESQRARDLETTIERTEQGNAARIEIRDPGSRARYDQCVRSARTPANCERFLPE